MSEEAEGTLEMLPSTASENAAGGVTCSGFLFLLWFDGVDMSFLGSPGLMALSPSPRRLLVSRDSGCTWDSFDDLSL
jgi:hypothetical protein